MEDPDRPGDHACPHTLVTSIPDGIHKHEHTHNVNRWIEAKAGHGYTTPQYRVVHLGISKRPIPSCCYQFRPGIHR